MSQGQDRYPALKAALIKVYGKTKATKNSELLEMAARPGGMGDLRPTNIMMKITNLSGSSHDALERAMFLNQLPTAVRTALAGSKAISNDELCAEADAVMDEFNKARRVNSVPHSVSLVGVEAVHRRPVPRSLALCYLHRKFDAQAFACRSENCPMKDKVRPPPVQGNFRAGRQ